jgi:iron complex outermembrane recepter protein
MKSQLLKLVMVIIALFFNSAYGFSQGKVTGKLKDASSGEVLIGASIKIVGTSKGAVSDEDGYFSLAAEAGTVSVEISYIGYVAEKKSVTVVNGQETKLGTIKLTPSSFGLGGVNIIADRARERETPVAFSNVSKKQLALQLGSQDLPMIMNNTPGVYATAQGGGAGDARINVRGFNQRNVAIMINGVPVNDMENGWVYWSNWDGVADATSSIQMQRGLSAVNLATPSIGGTMNIVTSPADNQKSVIYKAEVGSGNFMKQTITANSGLINNKYAVSASMVRKTGNGVIDGTWTDAWAYYLGASYNINKNHRIEAYLIGAPQRHGQNLYKQNVASYDSAFAVSIGADSAAAHKVESVNGQLFNENYSAVNSSYGGMQYWNGKERERFSKTFISERENYYHKPIANLNWYAQWSEKISQFTTVYYSGGTGGGSGTYGSMKWDYSEPTRIVDYNATIKNNLTSDTARGILRNSVNNQWTIGGISKVKIDFNENLKGQIGVDYRKAEIEHYYEIRDLLGGKFFYYKGNEFDSPSDYNKVLGDKIYYYNTNTVDWVGFYGQLEYSKNALTAYATYGYSMIKYSYLDHFHKDANGDKQFVEADWIKGSQIKGGVSYRLKKNFSVYGNFGLVSKVPIFDNVIDDASGVKIENPTNETFTSFELGADFVSNDNKLTMKGNVYYTDWKNRSLTKFAQVSPDEDTYVAIQGMNQNHTGVELEAKYRADRFFGFGALASIGKWVYTNDVTGSYSIYNPATDARDSTVYLNFYTSGLKVGDAPQTQLGIFLDIYPVKGMQFQAIYRYNANYYAEWDPFSRTKETDEAQVWQIPSFGLLDLHLSYVVPTHGNVGVELFGHVFNALNTKYIQDALDNSPYNGYYGVGTDKPLSHTANSAEVYMGLPRTFNVGIRMLYQ